MEETTVPGEVVCTKCGEYRLLSENEKCDVHCSSCHRTKNCCHLS